MADPITLPPLPIRSCIVTYMGDGRGLHYTLGVAAGTALIEQPPGSQLDLHTADQLRARDLEVARLVLEAAAQTCKQKAGRMRNMRDYAGGNALDHAAMLINELQVRHHE